MVFIHHFQKQNHIAICIENEFFKNIMLLFLYETDKLFNVTNIMYETSYVFLLLLPYLCSET